MNYSNVLCAACLVLSTSAFANGLSPASSRSRVTLDYASESCSTSTKLEGLLVLLHGKGGDVGYASLAKQFAAVSCRYKLLPVAVRAPSRSQGNWPFSAPEGEGQDVALDELVRETLPKTFGISPSKVAFVGISAGATFLMGDFVPLHGYRYQGVAIALCGGGFPYVPKISQPQTLAKSLPLYLQISKNDFLYRQSMAGVAVYKNHGVSPFVQITSENGHCAFDLEKAVDHALAMFLR